MLIQLTLNFSRNGTYLPVLESGATHSDKLDGQTTDQSSPDHAHANHFQPLANSEDLQTTGIFGRTCFGSSESFGLQRSLESKLLQRGRCHGGILWRVIWKQKTTPQLRWICQLQVSARSTKGTAYSGWPTPTVNDSKNNGSKSQFARNSLALNCQAMLTSWPTPTASNQRAISPAAAAREVSRLGGSAPLRVTAVHQLSGCPVEMASSDQPTGQLNPSLARWLMGLPPEWDVAAGWQC